MAADPRIIERALKAVAPAPSMGGYGNGPAPYISPGPSPLVASYNQWDGGHAYGTSAALPRDWFTFLSGMFGPSAPIQPVPVDLPEPGEERPFPRRKEYPISWDLNLGMPGTEGWGKLANFDTLRTLADLYCLDPATRVLCSDFTWRPLRSIATGDELIAFDETTPASYMHRKMRAATVTSCDRIVRPCYRIRLTDGRTVVASAEHLWLAGPRGGGWYNDDRIWDCDTCGKNFKKAQALGAHRRSAHGIAGWWKQQNGGEWIATEQLRPGSKIRDFGNPWETDNSRDGGYLAAAFDGEASLSSHAARAGWHIDFAQSPGAMLDLVERLLKEKGYRARHAVRQSASGVMTLPIAGMYDCMRFLGECRPVRLLGKACAWIDGRSPYRSGNAVVESIEFLGNRPVVAIGTSTKTLLAEGLFSHNSVARQCIELRKEEIRGIGWDIGPTRHAAKAMRGDHKAAADFADRQAKAVKFFRRPDPDYADFSSWLNAALEDFFVTDALAVFVHPSRAKRGGLFGSNIAGLDLIDGSLIKPLVDIRGGKPQPPNPCYQQYEWGVPRVDLMTLITEDTDDASGLLREYAGDQLLYLPFTRRSWTVYGMSFVEKALMPIMTGINKQQYQQQYFAEGSIPGLIVSAGDSSLTPSQIRELQDALNALSGDQAWKHKIIVLPSGSKADPMKPGPLADDFDTLVMIQTCMAFDVQPFELGIIPQLSAAAASSGTARQTVGARVDIRQRKSTIPLLLFLKAAIFDRILQDVCGMVDMEFKWEGLDEDENIADLTTALVEQIGAGLLSIDEGRQLLGRDPWGLPITSDPGWATQWGGLVPLTGVTEATAQPLGGSPGPGGPGRAAARPGGTPADFTAPGAASGPGAPPPTVPRNRMSPAQRRGQAHQVSATQNNTGSRGTPAHSGARAHPGGLGPVASRSPKVQAAARAATKKAIEAGLLAQTLGEFEEAAGAPLFELQRRVIAGEVVKDDGSSSWGKTAGPAGDPLRELSLLKTHLRRGGTVGEWQPRGIPGHVLASVEQDLAAGLSADYAIAEARKALAAKGASGYSLNPRSGMISLDLPEGTLEPLPGGVTDHHVTVVYLGPDVDDEAFGAAAERAREAAALVSGPLGGTVGGIGSFPASESSDGKVPVFAQVSLPGAELLRVALEDLSASEHPDWKPHVTLAYQDEGDPLPGPVPPRPVTFTHLTVHRGTDMIRHPLGGQAAKDAADLTDPNPVEPEHVKNQLRRNYPEKALGWIDGVHWIGPVLVPQDRIDDDDKSSWAASHQPEAVKRFAKKIKRGQGHLHPVVAVQEPGESKVKVIDGHHRTLAYRKLGQPVKAYVGFVGSNGGPWDETHSYQFHQGADPANKSAETPIVSTVHHPLGHEGLWHTPDRHVAHMQQLPAYVQNTARALMRDQSMGEQQAIATAINAIRAWAAGHAFGGKAKTTPQVQQAARRALQEWDRLKASHH